MSYAAARQKTVNAAKNAVFTKIAVVEKTMNKVAEGKAVAGRTQGDEQASFELWAAGSTYLFDLTLSPDGNYVKASTYFAYLAWQGRAALRESAREAPSDDMRELAKFRLMFYNAIPDKTSNRVCPLGFDMWRLPAKSEKTSSDYAPGSAQ